MNNDFDIEMNMNGVSNEVDNQKYSNFAVDPLTAGLEAFGKVAEAKGKTAEAIGKFAEARARKKEAEFNIIAIGGKRQAQNKMCDDAKENKFRFDPKKTKNRIRDCKAEVKTRLDVEEAEQRDIVRKTTAIAEGALASEQRRADIDLTTKTDETKEKKSSKKLYVFGGIFALVLVLGTIVYIKSKSK